MYPDRKNLALVATLGLCLAASLLGGCLSTPFGDPGPHYRAPAQQLSWRRGEVVRTASALIGTPYRYGGNRPSGFDCSGLVQFTHGRAGLAVPRTTALQWRRAAPLSRRHLLPGDLLFFSFGEAKAEHVAIYEGGGVFIHAPSSGKRVSRASLDNAYWRKHWVGSRTFL